MRSVRVRLVRLIRRFRLVALSGLDAQTTHGMTQLVRSVCFEAACCLGGRPIQADSSIWAAIERLHRGPTACAISVGRRTSQKVMKR